MFYIILIFLIMFGINILVYNMLLENSCLCVEVIEIIVFIFVKWNFMYILCYGLNLMFRLVIYM